MPFNMCGCGHALASHDAVGCVLCDAAWITNHFIGQRCPYLTVWHSVEAEKQYNQQIEDREEEAE